MGRKNLYEQQVKPHLAEVEEMASKGCTQQQIADALNINLRTFARYLDGETELQEAMAVGRRVAITEIENALFKSAVGSKELIKKGMKVKKVMYENGRKKAEIETIEPYEEEMYVKADTTAGIFLLKNWAKEKYCNDPLLYDLKVREQEFKEKNAGVTDDDNFDPFS